MLVSLQTFFIDIEVTSEEVLEGTETTLTCSVSGISSAVGFTWTDQVGSWNRPIISTSKSYRSIKSENLLQRAFASIVTTILLVVHLMTF